MILIALEYLKTSLNILEIFNICCEGKNVSLIQTVEAYPKAIKLFIKKPTASVLCKTGTAGLSMDRSLKQMRKLSYQKLWKIQEALEWTLLWIALGVSHPKSVQTPCQNQEMVLFCRTTHKYRHCRILSP